MIVVGICAYAYVRAEMAHEAGATARRVADIAGAANERVGDLATYARTGVRRPGAARARRDADRADRQ